MDGSPIPAVPALRSHLIWKWILSIAGVLAVAGLVQLHPLGRELDVRVMGWFGSSAVPSLLPFMRDPSDEVKLVALNELSRIGPTGVPNLIAALQHPEAATKIDAIAVLSLAEVHRGRQPEVGAALSKVLDDDHRLIQLAAVRGLAALQRFAADALPQLLLKLDADDPELRSNAIQAIVKIDPQSSQTLIAVIRQAKDPTPALRREACALMETMGTRDPKAVDALIDALRDPAVAVREMAVDYLGEIGIAGLPAIPALRELAEHDTDPNIRSQAAHALQSLQGTPEQ